MNHILDFQDSSQKTHVNFPHVSLTKASCIVKTDSNEMDKSNPLQEKGNNICEQYFKLVCNSISQTRINRYSY